MKTSRILVAWLLSVAVSGVFLFLALNTNVIDALMLALSRTAPGDRSLFIGVFVVYGAAFCVTVVPGTTLALVIFAHVIPGGFAVTLRGMLVVVALAAICLAIAGAESSPLVAWLHCAFSAFVTIAGLAWLCWQGRRSGRDGAAAVGLQCGNGQE
jgi:hypothetical protein